MRRNAGGDQPGAGADTGLVTNEWLETNIRAKGPLGRVYPRFMFIMEGDTPSYLGLIDNGLNAYRRPDWGGWGGRYVFRQPYGESRAVWTQGGDLFTRATSQDRVLGIDGIEHFSRQKLEEGHWADFSRSLFYVEGRFDDQSAYDALKSKLGR